jgi:hypothetical protein
VGAEARPVDGRGSSWAPRRGDVTPNRPATQAYLIEPVAGRVGAVMLMFLLISALVFALIAVHEFGHFLAGWMAGIPPRAMKVVLLAFPQHVALRDGERWVSPTREILRYIDVSRRFLGSRRAAFLWVAGGMVFELAFSAILCLAAWRGGWHGLACWTARMSLSLYLINVLLMDLPWAIRFRSAVGDTSGLWQIARWPSIVLSIAMLSGRVILVAQTWPP